MRITLKIDSASADEARAFIVAYQRTSSLGLPLQLSDLPTVEILGGGWTITTPALSAERAEATQRAFARLLAVVDDDGART